MNGERVVVIGGGASGMAASIAAAECGDQVLLLERMDRVGKKLLATGNGRCNLMNVGAWRYPGGGDFAAQVLATCGAQEQMRFWRAHGLFLRTEEDGRVYPASGQASTVLDVLRLAMAQSGVTVRTGAAVTALHRKDGRWWVTVGGERIGCDRVIVCGGGCAQPKLGSDGSCYTLLAQCGHDLTPAMPALTQVVTEEEPLRGLGGIRVKAGVVVRQMGQTVHRERGEVLFADYGVSGVCVMQCARYAQPGSVIVLDLLEGMGLTRPQARDELLLRRDAWNRQPLDTLMTGLCVPRLAMAVGKAAGVRFAGRTIGSLTDEEITRLTEALACFALRVRGVKGFESAQVTTGGVAVRDFDPRTLQSRLAPGLYAAGEVLDVDGDCGGFNLMFAFASGLLAGWRGRSIHQEGGATDDHH